MVVYRNVFTYVAYLLLSWLSLSIAGIEPSATLVSFPAGLSIALLMRYSLYQVAVGIFLAAFCSTLWSLSEASLITPEKISLSAALALAALIQAILGKAILVRFIKTPFTLSYDKDVFTFLVIVPLICLISPTLSFCLAEVISPATFSMAYWLFWWIGDTMGLLLLLPILLSFIGEPKALWRSRRVSLSILFLISAVLVTIISFSLKQFEQNRLVDRFHIRAQEISSVLQIALRTQELIQDGVARLFASSENVTREEFKTFVLWATQKNPYIQTVEWLPKISNSQRASYEEKQKQYFGEDFFIKEIKLLNDKKIIVRSGEYDFYFPITYLEPEWDNSVSLGFNPYSSVLSRDAIDKAIETGESAARSPLVIIRDSSRIESLILYRAIYFSSDERITLNKENEVLGLVNIAIRIDDFLNEVLGDKYAAEFTLRWRDNQSGRFYYGEDTANKSDINYDVPFKLAGREMQFEFSPTTYFIEMHATQLSSIVTVAGYLFSALFMLLFLSITGRSFRISEEVKKRTFDLSQATDRAQESETRMRDILTKMQLTEQQLRLSDSAFNATGEAMMIADHHKNVVAVNDAFSKITGFRADEIIDSYPAFFVEALTDDELSILSETFWNSLNSKGSWKGEITIVSKNKHRFPAYVSVSAIYDDNDRMSHFVVVFSDISEVKAAQIKIERQANYDALTDLPNRRLFNDRLQQAIKHSERYAEKLCLMFLDLDRFKDVNDTLGHEFGDELLKIMAGRIKLSVRDVDTVARLGGDEFTIILTQFDNKSQAMTLAQKLIKEIENAVVIKSQTIRVSTSIGITFYPGDGHDSSTLIQNADRAMYSAKEMGGSAFKFYNAELESNWLSRTLIMSELESALEKGELKVYYQPIISVITNNEEVQAEALVRWEHPIRGLIPPGDFLPQAERMGLIDKIDDYVFKRVCEHLKLWQKKGLGQCYISVNRSSHNFGIQRGRLNWLEHLKQEKISAQFITLEITESILMQKHSESQFLIQQLRDAGVNIAVDDFGTGYSSLSYLKEMDIDSLKIDRTFIKDIFSNNDDRAIVQAIIEMAKHLDIKVVAEGVETAQQADTLKKMGCSSLQGFYYSKPLPEKEFEEFLLKTLMISF